MESQLPDFKYTVDGGQLSLDQRRFYEDNGYVVIPKLVPSKEIQEYRQRFREICNGDVPLNGLRIMRDVAIKDKKHLTGEGSASKVTNTENDQVLAGYIQLPEVVEYVESFTGPHVAAVFMQLINKPPDLGQLTSRHPMHQDLAYLPFRPVDRVVTSWTAMQAVNRENGCLCVVPGSHKGELLEHAYPEWEGGVNLLYVGVKNFDLDSARVHLEMEEGDTVFFHPLLIHGAGANRSTDFRKVMMCSFTSGQSQVAKITDQQPIAQHIFDIIVKTISREVLYQDYWKRKTVVVKGDDRLKKHSNVQS